jgi:MFS family permease
VAGVAAGAGPVVGGALVSVLGWRSVFFVNVPIGIAGLFLAARFLPSPPRRPRGTDSAGQTTLAVCLAGLTVALATAAGFTYLQHVIALHAAIRDGDLAARPSYWQMTQIRHARSRGEPAHLVAHEDVTVFSVPATTREETAHAR